ncbi:unnamed protein product [Sphenostylis stenocarpa]|uniref:Uncharacterized protein n=1 Tax=Sphenostylis stenocarpa TaxID=92480 RepID=A0AA86SNB5_9FABA|nr:unnamed protein product [Sphenostylis stenocarpa]
MNGRGGKSMEEMNYGGRRKDDAVRVEGKDKEVVDGFCFQANGENMKARHSVKMAHGRYGVWKPCISIDNDSEKKRKTSYEDAEMDPEIQHLIETFWEVDNCPPSLTGEISLHVNKTEEARHLPPRPPSRPPPKKMLRVYKTHHLC